MHGKAVFSHVNNHSSTEHESATLLTKVVPTKLQASRSSSNCSYESDLFESSRKRRSLPYDRNAASTKLEDRRCGVSTKQVRKYGQDTNPYEVKSEPRSKKFPNDTTLPTESNPNSETSSNNQILPSHSSLNEPTAYIMNQISTSDTSSQTIETSDVCNTFCSGLNLISTSPTSILVNQTKDQLRASAVSPFQSSSKTNRLSPPDENQTNNCKTNISTSQPMSVSLSTNQGIQMITNRQIMPNGTPLSFTSTQPNGMEFVISPLSATTGYLLSSSSYMENLSMTIWQFYTTTKQSTLKYAKKVHLRNALHLVVSGVFENAGLFIVGSSINGFGSDQSDMDMCLTVTSRDLQQKTEAACILRQLLPPLKKCSFIHDLNLIHAKVPILKFRDTLTGVDCDLNVNNVVGIYNTHLLAMYTRIDWRVRPLGIFIKYWAQRMDIHDGKRGRLSTYPLLLMLILYLQTSCSPPILPNLQAKYPKIFNYTRPLCELDMRLELPWAELRSNNPASLAELFTGFIHYYTNEFNFNQWAISIRHGAPLPIDLAIKHLPPHEQEYTARNFKVFVEEPFSQMNAARSLYSDDILSRIKQAFIITNQTLHYQYPLESLWINNSVE
ncbi:unnamed protein product [Heterobilharzia americana]|nr:unnamed protein product [Heterobilharzia americana]